MHLERFSGPGSTLSRRKFWNHIYSAVRSARKIQGRYVHVSEQEGSGTLIELDANRTRANAPPGPNTGACCISGECAVRTEASCNDAGGDYKGNGVPCSSDLCSKCPISDDVNVVHVTFAGITSCGCVSSGMGSSATVTPEAINGTFDCSWNGVSWSYQDGSIPASTASSQSWDTTEDCTGHTFDPTELDGAEVIFNCPGDGRVSCFGYVGWPGGITAFYVPLDEYGPIFSGMVLYNLWDCTIYGTAYLVGGTATITW